MILQPGFNAYNGSQSNDLYRAMRKVPSLKWMKMLLICKGRREIVIAPIQPTIFTTVKIVECNPTAIYKIYNSTFQLLKC
ncbi:MAG: hypothetical protein IPJ26_14820 [Bacteroidetes bacterium]|nr:hypothetical protein [Bacteroidota bacterium]